MKHIKTFESFVALNEMQFKKGGTGSDSDYRILSDFLEKTHMDYGDSYDSPLTPGTKKIIYKFAPVISKFDEYELIAVLTPEQGSYSEELDVFLFNPSASTLAEAFCGLIELKANASNQYVNIEKFFHVKTYTIEWSNVKKSLQGSGLGKKMYSALYKWITDDGGCLQSDYTLYPGSAAIWTKYMPSIASWFGVNIRGILLPIDKTEIDKTKFTMDVDHLIAMENPPKEIRKISYNVQGLSFNEGEYGVVEFINQINDEMNIDTKKHKELGDINVFADIIEVCDTMQEFLKVTKNDIKEILTSTGITDKLKTVLCVFYDATVILKETKNGLVMVTI
jgi:hypothetical protein